MIPEQILADLSRDYPAPLPLKALEAAGAHRDALMPVFLSRIDEAIQQGTDASKETVNSFLFIFHLLGEWQEPQAYRPLIDFLRLPDDTLDFFFGDTLTSTAWRVIYGVFDGNFDPILSLINDASADDFPRWEMFRVLTAIALNTPIQRPKVLSFLEDFYTKFGMEGYSEDSYVWAGWGIAVSELQATEFCNRVKNVYDSISLCEHYGEWKNYEKELLRSNDDGLPFQLKSDLRAYETPTIENTIEELSKWHCFSQEALKREIDAKLLGSFKKRETLFSEVGKIGRNDPCPCGSGKKFKKCCLH